MYLCDLLQGTQCIKKWYQAFPDQASVSDNLGVRMCWHRMPSSFSWEILLFTQVSVCTDSSKSVIVCFQPCSAEVTCDSQVWFDPQKREDGPGRVTWKIYETLTERAALTPVAVFVIELSPVHTVVQYVCIHSHIFTHGEMMCLWAESNLNRTVFLFVCFFVVCFCSFTPQAYCHIHWIDSVRRITSNVKSSLTRCPVL